MAAATGILLPIYFQLILQIALSGSLPFPVGVPPLQEDPLLREAGYANGFKMGIIATNGRYPGDKATCEASAGMLIP